jgi:plastocyanin
MSKAKTLAGTVSTGGVLATPGSVPASAITGLATVATSGAYADLSGKPSLATVATTGAYADLSGKPSLATVATTGSYNDLTDKPTSITTATNLAGGSAGTVPYQSATGTTAMLAAGTAGQVLTSAGAAAPVWADAAGGLTYDFTLSQPITEGQIVQLLANGEIEKISATSTTTTEIIPNGSVSSPYSNARNIIVKFDPLNQNRFIAVWRDDGNSGFGTVALGTISGSSISWSSKFVFASHQIGNTSFGPSYAVEFDPAQTGTFVISYRNDSNSSDARVIAGQILSVSPFFSFGSPVGGIQYMITNGMAFDSAKNGKAVVSYKDDLTNTGKAFVVTVSGTTVSVGDRVDFGAAGYWHSVVANPNTAGEFIIAYGNSSTTVRLATISGTSLIFSASSSIGFNGATNIKYDPKFNRFLVINSSSGDNVRFAFLTLTSGTFNFANETSFTGRNSSADVDPYSSGKFVVFFRRDGGAYIRVVEMLASSFSVGSQIDLGYGIDNDSTDISFAPTGEGRFVTSGTSSSSSSIAAQLGQISTVVITTNLDSARIIGAIEASGTTDDVRAVALKGGVTDKQTGLTVGSTYYVLRDGTLSTTFTSTQPYAKLGRAISPTAILLIGDQ